jgi:DNA-binding transcriptional MerR regulator
VFSGFVSAPPSSRLSIGQLAQLGGVTPHAIRHYHATGLLPEPNRDGSGYRRYGPAELIALIRIVRLRTLGLPIAQIANHIGSARRERSGPADRRAASARRRRRMG